MKVSGSGGLVVAGTCCLRRDGMPRVIGGGFADCRIPTLYPMPWDIRMHSVVPADGTVQH